MKNYILILALSAIICSMFQACEKENKSESPSCEIITPINDQQIPQGELIPIVVEAMDPDGSVSEVKVFINEKEIGSEMVSPYEISWNTSNEALGSKTLKAVSTDNNNNQTSDEITVLIIEGGDKPEAAFSVNITAGIAPLSVQFSDESLYDPSGWEWDFGDGNTSTSQNPSQIYALPGVYSVVLTVSNPFGSDVSSKENYVTVLDENTFIDPRDDQSYKTVEIGLQTWFAENLNFEMNNSWCYDDIPSNGNSYGRLYTWFSAKEACPDGWHLPTDNEWKQLEKDVGMTTAQADNAGWRGTDEGKKLKSSTGWSLNGNGIDSYDFKVLAAGSRTSQGEFKAKGLWGLFWTVTTWDNNAIYRLFSYDEERIRRFNYSKYEAYSVRCIKD